MITVLELRFRKAGEWCGVQHAVTLWGLGLGFRGPSSVYDSLNYS